MNHNFKLTSADTDSILIAKEDESPFSEEERLQLLVEINSLFPETIRWEDDGYYPKVLILKAKNYVLFDGKKLKIKGSALRSSKTEKVFKEFMEEIIDCFIKNEENKIIDVYHKYVKGIYNIQDISKYCSKKTITEKVLNPERTNEQNVLDALNGAEVQMGDKVFLYFREDGSLARQEDWKNDHCKKRLIEKLYKTLCIFKNVLDVTIFPKYYLKNKKIQEALHLLVNSV